MPLFFLKFVKTKKIPAPCEKSLNLNRSKDRPLILAVVDFRQESTRFLRFVQSRGPCPMLLRKNERKSLE